MLKFTTKRRLISEAKKSLEFLSGSGDGPLTNCIYFLLVRLYTLGIDDVAQELNRGMVKFTFFQFELQVILLQFLEDLRNVEEMVCLVLGVDQDVVSVNDP